MKKYKDFWKKNIPLLSIALIIVLLIIVIIVFYFRFQANLAVQQEVDYTEFLQMVKEGKVDTVYYNPSEDKMEFTLLNATTKIMAKADRTLYKHPQSDYLITYYPAYSEFRKDMLESGVTLVRNTSIDVGNFVYLLSSFILILAVCFILLRTSHMFGDEHGESVLDPNVGFEDVIGHNEILEDVQFITKLIRNPDLGASVGAKVPHGILLSGPPGTGKTLIAKAIAGEAGLPFIYVDSSSLIEMFVGVGAKRVRQAFRTARKKAPCVIFFDEIDAIGLKRGRLHSTSEDHQTINALLQEMDGFNERANIFIIAATNHAEDLDPALVRAGRFDRTINVGIPIDWKIRRDLFRQYTKELRLDETVDLVSLAKQTPGFTGADIAAVCNEAALVASVNAKYSIDNECFNEAIDKKMFNGNHSKREQQQKDRERVAYHEAGHAITTWLLGRPISRISIAPTTSGVGGAVFAEDRLTNFLTRTDLLDDVMISYGGAISEKIKYGESSSGASNDIEQATETLLRCTGVYGFSESIGMLNARILKENHIDNDSIISSEIQKLSKECYDKAFKLLNDNYDKVEILAIKLLEDEIISGKEVIQLLGRSDSIEE